MREHEIDIEEDFAEYSFSNDHSESVRMVLDGEVARSSELIDNGRVDMLLPRPVSQYPGFQSNVKVRVGENILSDAEIDAFWP